MQVTPYQPVRGTDAKEQALASGLDRARAQEASVERAAAQVSEAEARSTDQPAAAPKRVLRSWNPGRQQRLDSARQARDYLRQLAAQLQRLKDQITSQLNEARREAQGASDSASTQSDVSWEQAFQELEQLWGDRQQRTAKQLDVQLNYDAGRSAQQHFRLRGLDTQSLSSGTREVLTFTLAGGSGATTSATVDPAKTVDANVARLDEALGVLGVRAGLDEQGQPIFSTDETSWLRVRDGLSVRGEGRRFASGAHNRARAEADAGAVQPQAWKDMARGGANLRQVLNAVTRALDRVKEAQREVSQALAEATAEMARVEDPAQAVFVESFEGMAQAPDYGVYEQVAPALNGISRERVVALLSLSIGNTGGA